MPARKTPRPRRRRPEPTLLPAFGVVLRQLRLERNLSQQELAHQIGSDMSVLSRLENARHSPSLGHIEALARALGKEPSELLRLVEQEAKREL